MTETANQTRWSPIRELEGAAGDVGQPKPLTHINAVAELSASGVDLGDEKITARQ